MTVNEFVKLADSPNEIEQLTTIAYHAHVAHREMVAWKKRSAGFICPPEAFDEMVKNLKAAEQFCKMMAEVLPAKAGRPVSIS